jgi:prepilin-type N-terminal cleavage/methylation domain-containing protein
MKKTETFPLIRGLGGSKKGFSLVELIVIVVIIGILSGAAYIGIQKVKSKNMNDKVLDDLIAISNSMEQYKRDHFGSYPIPTAGGNMNLNCFYADATFANDCTSTGGASFMQGMIDNDLLTKRYLSEVPTDPRTGSRYVYGVTVDGKYFQVAGLYENTTGSWTAKVVGNVAKGFHLPSLIRAYNGPNFVVEDGGNLPYSPDHLVISATLQNVTDSTPAGITVKDAEDNTVTVTPNLTVYSGYTITTVASTADLYFSDGSVTHLDAGASLQIDSSSAVEENDKDNIITKIRLKLFSGKIWNKVARLAQKSEFNIETTSAIAGVRGTEFGVDYDSNQVLLYAGEVCQLQRPLDAATGPYDVNVIKDCSGTGVIGSMVVDPLTAAEPILKNINDASPALGITNPKLEELMVSQTKHYLNDNLSPHILGVNGLAVTIKNINKYYFGDTTTEEIVMDKIGYSVDGDTFTSVTPMPNDEGNYVVNLGSSAENVVFRFEDTTNNLHSGNSTPPINVSDGTLITEADLYGGVGGVVTEGEGGGVIGGECTVTLTEPAVSNKTASLYWTPSAACYPALIEFKLNVNSVPIIEELITDNYYQHNFADYGLYTFVVTAMGASGPISNPVNGSFTLIEPPPSCGNGIIDAALSETCDDGAPPLGNNGKYGFCNASCTGIINCGDGMMQTPQETCDYGEGYNIAAALGYICDYGYNSCTVCNLECQSITGIGNYCGDYGIDTPQEECEISDVGCTPACLCNVDNHFAKKATGSGCECQSGYHLDGTSCVADACIYGVTTDASETCTTVPYATLAIRTHSCVAGNTWGAWSDCIVQSCVTGYEPSIGLLSCVLSYTPLYTFVYNIKTYQISNVGANYVNWDSAVSACQTLTEGGAPAGSWFLPDKDMLIGTYTEWASKLPTGGTLFWSSTEYDVDNTQAWWVRGSDGYSSVKSKTIPTTSLGFRCFRQVP